MSKFRTRVVDGSRTHIDEDQLKLACETFFEPKEKVEIFTVLTGGRGAIGRCIFGEYKYVLNAVNELTDGIGTYWTINPVRNDLSGRPKIGDITRRSWFIVDVDPRKAEGHQGDSASDPEWYDARDTSLEILGWLTGKGFPLPVILDSGNGAQLLYKIDLPNDLLTRSLIAQATNAIGSEFKDRQALVDTGTAKANQGAKLPGTMARKGICTDDRPHRPCRILSVPEKIEVLSPEVLAGLSGQAPEKFKSNYSGAFIPAQEESRQDVGSKPEAEPSPNGATPDVAKATNGVAPHSGLSTTVPGDREYAYAKAAYEAELTILRNTSPGNRQNQLNKSAFKIGTLVGANWVFRSKAENDLEHAAWQIGLHNDGGENKIRDTIRRAINDGAQFPRHLDEEKKASKSDEKKASKPNRLTVGADEIKPEKVNWLWPDRIPRNFITIFAGRTGLGKSFILTDMMARLSRGGEIPDSKCGECFPIGKTLYISEDPHAYVIVPRLIEAGANRSKIKLMTWDAMAAYDLTDTDYLSEACEECDWPDLIVIDPPTNFIGDKDEHKNSDVRRMIMKIVSWMDGKNVAIVFILHVNKNSGKDVEALTRVMGSVAWVSTSRIAHTFSIDPEDPSRHVFIPAKNNLGPLAKGLAYRFEATGDLARVKWLGEIDTSADEAMAGLRKTPSRKMTAARWLTEQFRDRKEWPSKEIYDAAREEGISDNAIFEARKLLKPIRAKKVTSQNGNTHWVWCAPSDWPPPEEESNSGKSD